MSNKRLPTQGDLKVIAARLRQHPNVTKVSISTVLNITVEIDNAAVRHEIYEVEGKVIDRFPDLLFDFHTEVPCRG